MWRNSLPIQLHSSRRHCCADRHQQPIFEELGNCNYTIAKWTQMEASGAVFLPATGLRQGQTVIESNGGYRTSTPITEYSACNLFIGNTEMSQSGYSRLRGYSLRLVGK